MALVIGHAIAFAVVWVLTQIKKIKDREDVALLIGTTMIVTAIGIFVGVLMSLLAGASLPDNNITKLENEYILTPDYQLAEKEYYYCQYKHQTEQYNFVINTEEKDIGLLAEEQYKGNNEKNITVQEWRIQRNDNIWIDITGNNEGPLEYKILIPDGVVISDFNLS